MQDNLASTLALDHCVRLPALAREINHLNSTGTFSRLAGD